MKIIYHPAYDGLKAVPFIGTTCRMGVLYAGSEMLLQTLELHTGLYVETLSDIEREADYLNALMKQGNHPFLTAILKNSDMKVAAQLLRWRDALMMEGWIPTATGESEKLDALAAVEQEFHTPGLSDRWRTLVKQLHTADGLTMDIEVHTEPDCLPAMIRTALDILDGKGCTVHYIKADQAKAQPGTDLHHLQLNLLNTADLGIYSWKNDETLRVLSFKNRQEAYEWFAVQQNVNSQVVVNRDNAHLNSLLSVWDRPRLETYVTGSHSLVLQLFKLGFSLFVCPINIHNLLAYLQLPVHPLPAAVRYTLVSRLCNEGGIRSDWDEQISEEAKIWLPIVKKYDYEIPTHDILKYSGTMQQWAVRRKSVSQDCPELITVLERLTHYCKALDKLLAFQPTVTSDRLMNWVKDIYSPVSMKVSDAEDGSPDNVSDMGQLASGASQVIWLDCNNSATTSYPFDFLNDHEISRLSSLNVQIPDHETLLAARFADWTRAVLNITGSLTVVTAEYDGNKRLPEHPFLAMLRMFMGNAFLPITPKLSDMPGLVKKTESVIRRQPQMEYRLGKSIAYEGRTESQSSIAKLIQHPFDYTLHYVAKLREPDYGQLKDLRTTKGLVAHALIEQLINEGQSDQTRINSLFTTDYDRFFAQAIRENGAVFQLKEHRVEADSFKALLRKSVSILIKIMDEKQLTPIGCEVTEKTTLAGIGPFQARIDLLMKDAHDRLVIFDLKWSEWKSHYVKQLQDDLSVQLELYRQTFIQCGQPVSAVAYYLLPLSRLYTSAWPEGEHIRHIDAPANSILYTRIWQSVNTRLHEIRDGELEEAELMPLDSIPYTKNNLYPLAEDYTQKKLKATAYIPTYQTLKGRLK